MRDCRDGSELTANPQQDRKQILADPDTAYRDRFPQATQAQRDAVHRLHSDYTDLKQQQSEIQELTRKLSRKIGAEKRDGNTINALVADMQAHSAKLKAVTARRQQAETALLEYFADSRPDTQAPPSDATPAGARYPADVSPEEHPDIALFDGDNDAWNAYVDSHPAATIYHRAEWRDLIRQTFGHACPYFLAHDRDQRVIGILPLVHLHSRLFGNFMISMPYFNYGGALAATPLVEQRLMEAANDYAGQAGIGHIEYRDTIPREGLPVRNKKVCMLLELPGTPESLWEQFPSKLRAQIRRPQRETPEVRCGGLECLDDFYAVFARNMRDLGTPVYSKAFFANILQTFTGHCKIISIRLHNQPVAAGFLLGYRGQLEIPWASTIRDVNHLSMNMLLYWEVLKFAIAQNYRQFDFGRSSRDSGTFRFKQQWGAKPCQIYWHYWQKDAAGLPELNPDNPKYALAINTWKRLPLWMANRIGPAVVKYLP